MAAPANKTKPKRNETLIEMGVRANTHNPSTANGTRHGRACRQRWPYHRGEVQAQHFCCLRRLRTAVHCIYSNTKNGRDRHWCGQGRLPSRAHAPVAVPGVARSHRCHHQAVSSIPIDTAHRHPVFSCGSAAAAVSGLWPPQHPVHETPQVRATRSHPSAGAPVLALPKQLVWLTCLVLCVWLLRRSKLRNHPGQISFPGGKIDATDANETATALRELHEEVGIPADRVQILGILPDAIAKGTHQTVVTPVVGFVRDLDVFPAVPAPDEVDSVFTVPFSDLLDPARQDTYLGTPRFLMPQAPDSHIWGFTGFVLKRFLSQIAPPHDSMMQE